MSPDAAARHESLLERVRKHHGPDVTLDHARNRTSAYIYGNILVLAAVAAVSPDSILHWGAFVAIVATTVTTFLAHVLAHGIGQQIGRSDEESRLHLAQEIRDAVPIISSGAVPALFMLLGALHVISPFWAQVVGGGLVVVRLALAGVLIERMTGRRSSWGVLWSGFVLAFASAVIVVLKVLFTH
ncbi:hypothetical protein [Frondihabitans cladoniiphilus]|uniref:Uncharacterized protein n=1 Tax=Frondihabitans cladoniiphilus TaxID=715785 RepID=A0ABP8WB01_9MICO